MEEKNDLDQYAVPVTSRPKYFAFKVFGGWSAAGVMFAILLRCFSSKNQDQKEFAREKSKIELEIRKQARAEAQQEFENVMRVLEFREQRLNTITEKVDSLKKKI